MGDDHANEPSGVHVNRDVRIDGDHNRIIGGDSIEHNVLLNLLPALTSTPIHLLPPDIADFTGRQAELAELKTTLLSGGEQGASIGVIAGKPGVGKSALAVHMAHQISKRFPDGQLYINLRGADQQPLSAEQALTSLLQVHGVPINMLPGTLDGKELMWHRLVAGRRLLVLLDNALDDAQVRRLLPGSPTCVVLITSRTILATLGAKVLQLENLDSDQASRLLARIVGQDRLAGDREALATVIELCAGLPLALRIAGAKLVQLRHRDITWLAGRLSDERRRLSELGAGDLQIRASFQLSYMELADQQAKAFRRLGLWGESSFDAHIVATLLEVDRDTAEEILDGLVRAQLVEPASARPNTYRMHDLLHLFARELLEREETGAGREGALERLLAHSQTHDSELVLVEQLQAIVTNMARRSQALIDRQLELIDDLERNETDPETLEHLFRLDHLATRMRRNADNMLVVSGADLGRGRHFVQPMTLVDVARAAAAEVEEYQRVAFLPLADLEVVGYAAVDVIHLLAELIENATAFSPPNTKVQIAGQAVPHGYVIEIEDRGLGMSDEELIQANERLANPPEIALSAVRNLGLNVIGRLNQRHGIKVQLRHSWYGGVTALTLLPHALLIWPKAPRAVPNRPSE